MLNRAKKQGPKTFCAMFQVAWDLTWLGCEGMKKNRHTHTVKMGSSGLCLLCQRVPNTQFRASCVYYVQHRGSLHPGWVARKFLSVSYESGALSPVSMSTVHIHPGLHLPFLHPLKASLVPLSTARIICIPFKLILGREQRFLLYFCQLLTR